MFRDIGGRTNETDALNCLGEVLTALGQPGQAGAQHRQALTLASEASDRYQQARAHDGLARAYHAAGDTRAARYHWEIALSLYHDLGVPDEKQARAALDSLDMITSHRG